MTRFYRSGRLAVLAASGLIASACADSVGPTAPAPVSAAVADQAATSAQAALNWNLLSTLANKLRTRVTVLTRRSPLNRDYVVAADIGPAGGSLQINEAGVTITFPRNAVSQRTRITMRALAGRTVAYQFEPHGLDFGANPVIEQDLDKTNWKQLLRGNIEGAYFADAASLSPDLSEADAEQFFVSSIKGEKTLSFSIPHFSGYLVSSGRRGTK